jgi:hypothetical protein
MSTVFVMFDFDDDRLLDHSRIVALMQTLADDGWRFLKKAIVCDDVPGDQFVPNEPEYIARAWQNALRAAPRMGGGNWMEFLNIDDLKFSFGYDGRQPRRLMLTAGTALIRRREQAPNVRVLAGLIELIYRQLAPVYGYGLFSYDHHAPLAPDGQVRALWDFNLFGPALVSALGREKLRYLPAWRSVEFDDGGLLLEMAAHPIADAAPYIQFYRHAAETLGVPYHSGAAL